MRRPYLMDLGSQDAKLHASPQRMIQRPLRRQLLSLQPPAAASASLLVEWMVRILSKPLILKISRM